MVDRPRLRDDDAGHPVKQGGPAGCAADGGVPCCLAGGWASNRSRSRSSTSYLKEVEAAGFERQRHETVLLAIVILVGVLALMEMGSVLVPWMKNPVVLFAAGLVALGVVLAASRAQRTARPELPSN